MEGTYWEDHPGRFQDVVELQFFNQFLFGGMFGDINLVGQDEQGRITDAAIVEQLVQFLLGRDKLLGRRRIDHVQNNVTPFGIPTPFCSILLLAT